ncbi:SIR2 family protein [Dyadobacter sp. CY323]|uniref:SIR2 family protein n=1 Tax=Dyadobacter sp. CY323 TaxID=2907302 RepID=UPI001F158205|nr:SIR2 family protein [Dyadobacter sp. CY323]MCE6991956.1 SIR2 family protein [Dyadobacter sp. CY323]
MTSSASDPLANCQNISHLNTLARDLAFNMVDIATEENELKSAIDLLLDPSTLQGTNESRRVRNILIVGAGATRNANESIPTAWGVVESLYDHHGKDNPAFKISLQKIEDDIKNNYPGAVTDSFEAKLRELEKVIGGPSLRAELRQQLGYKHVTSQFYEIVGHMFKHRLIDVIINFNFDEILDNVIDDEMGAGEYYKILLNGHCPDDFNDLYMEYKLALPIYIKPHGTVSHAGSLKFTYNQYNEGNISIKSLIADLLSRNHERGTEISKNIIAVGYSFKDVDLHSILKNAALENKDKFSYYIFDSKEETEYLDNTFFQQNSSLISPVYFQTDKTPLGDLFKKLWELATNCFKSEFRDKYLKGIERHEIIASLFHKTNATPIKSLLKKEDPNYTDNKKRLLDFLEKRIYVEIAIVLAKSKGLVHINQFKESRLKKYISLFYEQSKGHPRVLSLAEFINHFDDVETYMEVMKDTYVLTENMKPSLDSEVNIEELTKSLAKATRFSVNTPYFRELFTKVSQNKLCIVNSDIREYYLSPFTQLSRRNLLYSDTRWLWKFRSKFVETNWNIVLSISESGEILNDPFYYDLLAKRKSVVWTILADYRIDRSKADPEQKGAKSYPDVNCKVEYLPWETHNKHMYIFLNVNDRGKIKLRYGIYYTRRLLSDVVNPIYLDTEPNLEILFDYFCSYWLRAKSYSEEQPDLKRTAEDFRINKEAIKKQLVEEITSLPKKGG